MKSEKELTNVTRKFLFLISQLEDEIETLKRENILMESKMNEMEESLNNDKEIPNLEKIIYKLKEELNHTKNIKEELENKIETEDEHTRQYWKDKLEWLQNSFKNNQHQMRDIKRQLDFITKLIGKDQIRELIQYHSVNENQHGDELENAIKSSNKESKEHTFNEDRHIKTRKQSSVKAIRWSNFENSNLKSSKKVRNKLKKSNIKDKNEFLSSSLKKDKNILKNYQMNYSEEVLKKHRLKIENMDKNELKKEIMLLLSNIQQIELELETAINRKISLQKKIKQQNKQIYKLVHNVEYVSNIGLKRISEYGKQIENLTKKQGHNSNIALALWTSYLEMKEAKDDIQRKYEEFMKRDDSDTKAILQKLKCCNSQSEELISNRLLKCKKEKEAFKIMMDIMKQKTKVNNLAYSLIEQRNNIMLENQMLKNDNRKLRLEKQHYKRIAAVHHSNLLLPAECTSVEE